MSSTPNSVKKKKGWKRFFRLLIFWLVAAGLAAWLFLALMLAAFRWIDPPTTALQIERRVQSWTQRGSYEKRYKFVPLSEISLNLQHAVIAAEDARFYEHHGFDWNQVEIAAEEDLKGGRVRGASTLTQQLVKNLFFGTSRSIIRKGAEASLVPVAEFVLGKQRILELYLNVVEWGPGVYGAEEACHYHFRISARSIGRQQSAELAAVLPAPLKRRPEHMGHYADIILTRMRQMNW